MDPFSWCPEGGVPLNTLILLGIVALLAFIAPFFAKKLKLPIVVGEILFGVIVGIAIKLLSYADVNIDLSDHTVDVLSTLGFIMLMFMIGLENDFGDLKTLRRSEKIGTGLVIISSFLISLLAVFIMGLPMIVGLILGGVSVAVVIPVLKEMGLRNTRFGFRIMLLAQIADVVAIILISLVAASIAGWVALIYMIIIPIFFLMAFWIMDSLIWHRPRFMSKIFNPTDDSEMGVRAALAIMLIFYGLATFIGLEAILGAFLCGILFSAIFKEREVIIKKLMPIGFGFLIPIFFITQGLEVNIMEIAHPYSLFLILIFTLITVFSKVIPLMLARYFKHTWSDMSGSMLLGANLSVIVAGVRLGEEAGLLDEHLSSVLILYGVISCILFPTLFRKLQKRYMEDMLQNRDEDTEEI